MPDQPDNRDAIIADLRLQLAAQRVEITLLRQKIDLLIRQVFGSKSERLDPAQLELLLAEVEPKKESASLVEEPLEEASPASPTSSMAPSPRSGRNKPRWPADLPIEETVIEPELVLAHPEDWRLIGSEPMPAAAG